MSNELLTYEEIQKLVRWTAPFLMPGIDREDLEQEAYLKFLQASQDPNKGGEKSWLVTQVVNCVRTKLRDEKRKLKRGFNELPETTHGIEQDFGIEAEHLDKQVGVLYALLDKQDERTRRIVNYRMEGDTHETISAKLGVSRVTVIKDWQRFKDLLRRKLQS